jgi:hypothetical protein
MKRWPLDEIVAKSTGAILLVLICGAFTWHVADQLWFTCPHNTTSVELSRPFSSEEGHTFKSQMPQLAQDADNPEAPKNSKYLLCEGTQLMGPAHSLHAEIATLGQGRYSHWGNTFIISATDNTDPNTNGRRYIAVRPRVR